MTHVHIVVCIPELLDIIGARCYLRLELHG